MTAISRRPLRRALVVPASMAIVAGGLATTVGLLSPQRAAAVLTCPVLAENPQTYSTGEHCFTIPANVSTIHAVLVGGTGGAGAAGQGNSAVGAGGLGGHGMQVSGDVAVAAGQLIYVYVGGDGQAGVFDVTSGAGGYNGGGQGAATATGRTSPVAEAGRPTFG